MSHSRMVHPAVSVALGAALVVPMIASTASAKEEAILRLRASAVNLNNGARTGTIDKAIPRAKLTLNKEGVLEIENYEREPVRLNEVTVVK